MNEFLKVLKEIFHVCDFQRVDVITFTNKKTYFNVKTLSEVVVNGSRGLIYLSECPICHARMYRVASKYTSRHLEELLDMWQEHEITLKELKEQFKEI